MKNLNETLNDRGSKYGDYEKMSNTICKLQAIIKQHAGPKINAGQYHALQMIMVKIGRILTGDPDYDDNWRDIAGYATKVTENLPDVIIGEREVVLPVLQGMPTTDKLRESIANPMNNSGPPTVFVRWLSSYILEVSNLINEKTFFSCEEEFDLSTAVVVAIPCDHAWVDDKCSACGFKRNTTSDATIEILDMINEISVTHNSGFGLEWLEEGHILKIHRKCLNSRVYKLSIPYDISTAIEVK